MKLQGSLLSSKEFNPQQNGGHLKHLEVEMNATMTKCISIIICGNIIHIVVAVHNFIITAWVGIRLISSDKSELTGIGW